MTEAVQSELVLFADSNASAIASLLRRSSDWLKASQILARLHLPDTESNRRLIRACAEALDSELISGQAGYKHIDAATDDEVLHFARWMLSQGKKMTLRAQLALARKGLASP